MTIKSILFILIAFFFNTSKIIAQITFEKSYALQVVSEGNSVKQTLDGGYIVAGTYVTKTSDSGVVEWIYPKKTSYVNTTSDSGFILISNNTNIIFTKLNKLGDTIWTSLFTEGVWAREAYSIEQTNDGGYIVAGRFQDVAGSGMMLLKLSNTGIKQWKKTFMEPTSAAFCYGRSVHQTADGGYIIAGYTYINFYDSTAHKDVFVVKTDSVGNNQWMKNYGSSKDEYIYEIHELPNGEFIMAGSQYDSLSTSSKMFALKLNAQGDTIWTGTYKTSYESELKSIWPTTDGSFIGVGSSNESTSGGKKNLSVIKINASGTLIWDKEFGGIENDYGNAIQQTIDGGYIMTGATDQNTSSFGKMYLIKLDSSGNLNYPLTNQFIENNHSNISIFPNPASKDIHLFLPFEQATLRVFSSNGLLILNKELKKGLNHLSLSMCKAGIYFIEIRNEKGVLKTEQLFVEN